MRYHKLLSNNKGDRRSGKSSDSKTVSLLSFVFASRCCNLKTVLYPNSPQFRTVKIVISEIFFCFVDHEYRLKLYYHAPIFACKMFRSDKLMIRLLILDFKN